MYRLAALAFTLAPSLAGAVVLDGKVTGGAGVFVRLEAGPEITVGRDTFESPNLFAFDEDQNITIPDDIRVEIGPPGGVIPRHSVVASHYVFFDPAWGMAQRGWVEFDAPILGVATSVWTMQATDFLANTKITYLNPGLRGLEWEDAVWIDPDNPFRLWVSWAASTPGDYIRVFTARSPGV